MIETILIVDDLSDPRESLAEVLRQGDWRCQTADSAADCMRQLNLGGVDVVVLEAFMGDRDGVDGIMLLSVLRNRFPDIPVAVVTRYPYFASREECLDAGAWIWLERPRRFEDVGDRMHPDPALTPSPTKRN